MCNVPAHIRTPTLLSLRLPLPLTSLPSMSSSLPLFCYPLRVLAHEIIPAPAPPPPPPNTHKYTHRAPPPPSALLVPPLSQLSPAKQVKEILVEESNVQPVNSPVTVRPQSDAPRTLPLRLSTRARELPSQRWANICAQPVLPCPHPPRSSLLFLCLSLLVFYCMFPAYPGAADSGNRMHLTHFHLPAPPWHAHSDYRYAVTFMANSMTCSVCLRLAARCPRQTMSSWVTLLIAVITA